jgi:hypothetical protein
MLAREGQCQVALAHGVNESVIQQLWTRFQNIRTAVRRPEVVSLGLFQLEMTVQPWYWLVERGSILLLR